MAKKDLVTYLANIVLVSSVDIYFINEKTLEFYPEKGKYCRGLAEAFGLRHKKA